MRRALALAGTMVAAAGLGGCGLLDSGTNLVNGKQQFVDKCGACHVLNRAGTAGTVGPSLDAAFARARADGFGESTLEGIVRAQIDAPAINPSRDPATGEQIPVMPADLVTGDDAEDVAAYVASAAAKPGEDPGQLAQVGGGQGTGGEALFTGGAQPACSSCHTLADAGSNSSTGPDLDEALAGQDAEYIRRAIVDPDAEIAEGFQPGIMPTDYGETLDQEQLDQLVEYLADVAGG